jgi:hypothetical protein
MARQEPETHEPATPRPSRQHERLNSLAGHWRIEGRNLGGAPDRPGAVVVGHASFRWLAGHFFLYGEKAVAFGGQSHVTLMVLCYLDDVDEYRAYFFDNGGFSRQYAGEYAQGVWRFNGRRERVRIETSADGRRLDHFWERTDDGRKWVPLCELTSTRID